MKGNKGGNVRKNRIKTTAEDTCITIRLSRAEKKLLHEKSRLDGRTASGQMRWLILQFINGNETTATA